MIFFMLNYRQHIITRTAAIILVCVVPLASAAFHGHTSDDKQQCADCAASACCCCQNAADCDQQPDNDNSQPHHKCHCSGFHTMQSILHGLDIQNILLQQPFYTPDFQITIPQFSQNIFQPPKN